MKKEYKENQKDYNINKKRGRRKNRTVTRNRPVLPTGEQKTKNIEDERDRVRLLELRRFLA